MSSECLRTLGSDGVLNVQIAALGDSLDGILVSIQGLDGANSAQCEISWIFGTLSILVASFATAQSY